ncbi:MULTISPECIES: D-alanyl-D-alanine carboxypeptidase family protein [Streptomycetaceae]|uniref:Penicillin binding protein PbpA n=1 Tax=Streptantibioticus cattleyicolor (strain ATCC 35852 / DSM 46488 / JCM 4925 / NBRC 14057 / NRRL 8057) TaxID=1003195 RepID=F8JTX2_STREN|nr:D-alanyl-D-alanine carboxypeptidase [Streptantibioticus cattleyicolor]AEW98062.1 penicillin binding protein PbpA [Streptantibioticus cattleyicolor NRRL 8057 = DSM 46488]MYS62456.1 D-alanyl-D-alanine carboxypeptidase [Streptomyces sp. SID5468]CCB78378.1 Penicillin binding protein [Streptantibioticus cattleyicolor NRRL 8057 = DSM 46488]
MPVRARIRALAPRVWGAVVAFVALVLLIVQMVRPLPEPVVGLDRAVSSFTVPGGGFAVPWPAEGQGAVAVVGSGVVGTFGTQRPVPTASIAKIMTAYVILRDHPLGRDEQGPRIPVDAQAVADGKAEDESRVEGLREGETFSEQDMLRMLMIPSGNNIARLLARWDTHSSDVTVFAARMNQAAKDLGMRNTTYTDPSGLDRGTVSTAVDQLVLAEQVMRYDAFRVVVAQPDADIPGLGRIYNNNSPLLMAGLSVRGIKTGSNTPAGGTLSWAAYKTVDGADRLILGAMLGQHVTGPDPNGANSLALVLNNSKKVIAAVRDALTSAVAVRKGQVVGHVDDGLGHRAPVVATADLTVVGVPGQKLTVTPRGVRGHVPRTAKAGTVLGELTTGTGATARRVPIALAADLVGPSFWTRLTRFG